MCVQLLVYVSLCIYNFTYKLIDMFSLLCLGTGFYVSQVGLETHYVSKGGFWVPDLPASPWPMLELQAHTIKCNPMTKA